MPEWLIERGIGEIREARVVGGQIVEARIWLEGTVRAGTVIEAILKKAGTPAIASDGDDEYLLPKGAAGATEGKTIIIEVTRERIPGCEPWKRPLARISETVAAHPVEGEVIAFPAAADRLSNSGWADLVEEARSGIIRFEGGELRVSLTPAMTLIDVDGTLPPLQLARKAATEAPLAILRHGIGGSIGIDFPTVKGKQERQAIGQAIDALLPQPFERTGMNGFGFMQIVRSRAHASLFELASDRAAFEARALLRQAALEPPGPKCLVAHPAVVSLLQQRPDWRDRLAGQIGGVVSLRADASLSMSGGYAEPA